MGRRRVRIVTRYLQACAALVLAIVGAIAMAPAAAGDAPVYKSFFGQVAIEGYDVVAYFEDHRARQGTSKYSVAWNGAHWQFASPRHKDMFASDPERYAPAYGGFCAYSVAFGHAVKSDPEVFAIVDGRLFLLYSESARAAWADESPSMVAKADQRWPMVVETYGLND